MRRTYGVVWREGDEPLARGKLELLAHALRLDGLSGTDPVSREIAYDGLAGVHVGRSPAERLNGHSTLVLEPASGASISLAAVAQPGIVGELAERLAELRLASGTKTAILLPLREGSRGEAQRLLESGPPFDPAETRLERHEVYLGDREVLFVFESRARRRGARAVARRRRLLARRSRLGRPPGRCPARRRGCLRLVEALDDRASGAGRHDVLARAHDPDAHA